MPYHHIDVWSDGKRALLLLLDLQTFSAGISFSICLEKYFLRTVWISLQFHIKSEIKMSSENMQVEDQSVGDSWRRIRLL